MPPPARTMLIILLASAAIVNTLPSSPRSISAGMGKSAASSEMDPYDEHLANDGTAVGDSHAAATDLSDVELMAEDEEEDDDESYDDHEADDEETMDDEDDRRTSAEDNRKDGQHFFPSFAPLFNSPPLGHSRPHSFDEAPAPVPRPSYQDSHYRYRSTYPEETERVLGSGNFGVIKGGTYYGASDDPEDYDGSYYRGNNGHGRPPYFRGNPQPAYRHGGDFFAGFRDFADITTPAKPAYSQYFVVYANRNSTKPHPLSGPKNIIEQLALLDQMKQEKQSKTKKKLAAHKEKMAFTESKKKFKSPKEALLYEPLLALS